MTDSPDRLRRTADEKTPRELLLQKFNEACEAAAEARKVNRKLRQEYRNNRRLREKAKTLLIEDLIRVYTSEENPYAGWAASRERYRQLGHYPEIMRVDLFGTHAEFEREAGLRDKRGTEAHLNATAKLATEKSIREYAEETVMSTAGLWSKAYGKKTKGVRTIVVGSDFHGQMVDPFALRVWLDVIRLVKPDGVIGNGDMVDFEPVSRFSHIPGASSLSLTGEIRFTRKEILIPTREAAPDAWMTWHIGNHEHRLVRYLADTAPELADLELYDDKGNRVPLRWDTLFGTKSLGIEMVFGGNWLAPTAADHKNNIRKTFKVYYDSLVVTHGMSTAKIAMEAELLRFGLPGTSGHTHRPGIYTRPTLANPHLSWTSTGMMAGFAVGKNYVDGPSSWTMGFAVFTIDLETGIVVPNPVTIYEDFATFGGYVWRPTEKEKALRRHLWGEGGEITASERPSRV